MSTSGNPDKNQNMSEKGQWQRVHELVPLCGRQVRYLEREHQHGPVETVGRGEVIPLLNAKSGKFTLSSSGIRTILGKAQLGENHRVMLGIHRTPPTFSDISRWSIRRKPMHSQ
jgi:hypothetical protein